MFSLVLITLLLVACGDSSISVAPTASPRSEPSGITPTPTETPTSSPTHAVTPTSTDTPIPPTATATPTSSPTHTVTPTPTDTPIPPTATATPDLTTLGEPRDPFPWEGFNPPGFLAYNEEESDIYQRNVHGRPITIAWVKITNVPETRRQQVSEFYFATFIKWWDVFGGFPYSSYTVVLKNDSEFAGGEQGIGYEGIAKDYAGNYRERVAHEVFHAWVGNALRDTQEQKFDDGLWFREGITQYYGNRGAGATEYRNWMRDHWRIYQNQVLGTEYDIPLTDMPARGRELGEDPTGNDRPYRLNVYWKGALVAYLMDQGLATQDLSFDDFLKYMYDTYALQRREFTSRDAIQALSTISGEDWTDFFNRYIYGVETLPLDGNFEYLQH